MYALDMKQQQSRLRKYETGMKKFQRRTSEISDGKEGFMQDADVQCSVVLHVHPQPDMYS